ncbi:MAG: hypothetical protein M3Q39_00105 [Actinomycetota bacterium]|nr:hypothetical protein [Actinomycetota bacterium]
MSEQTGAEVRATAADAARQARAVLAALADPNDELTTTPPRARPAPPRRPGTYSSLLP